MGFPYTTGYYSKDVILELSYSNYYIEGLFAYCLGVLAAGCTAFYSVRLLYLTFIGETNSFKSVIRNVHDSPIRMAIPLIVLSFGSMFVGYVFKDMFIGLGTSFWGNSLGAYNSLGDVLLLEAEFLPAYIKLFPVAFSLFFGFLAYTLYDQLAYLTYLGGENSFFFRSVYAFFNKKWYFDAVYNWYIVRAVLSFGYNISFKLLDRGAIELVGPTGLVRFFSYLSRFVSNLQTGFLFHYVLFMAISVIGFVYLINHFVVVMNSSLLLFLVLAVLAFVYNPKRG